MKIRTMGRAYKFICYSKWISINTSDADDIRQQMQSIGTPLKDKFMIWRDIYGNMIYPDTKLSYGAQYYDNQHYPGHGASGVTVGELKNTNQNINRKQVENFDSGVKIGNSIEF